MGYAVSWLAVRGTNDELLLRQLQLEKTGEAADPGDEMFTGSALPSGWWVLFINQCEHDFVKSSTLESLSASTEVLACSIEEHVMWSRAELWRDGAEIWRIEHDAQKSIDDLATSGTLPSTAAAIEKEFAAKQTEDEEVDYFFEIPLQVAKGIVGFKHDEAAPGIVKFTMLRNVGPNTPRREKKPWWKFS